MPDIAMRFNRDMLVLSAPLDAAFARQGIDAARDRQYLNLVEPDQVLDALRFEEMAGAQCLVTPTEDITKARLAHVRMDGDPARLAHAAVSIANELKPQHVLAEIGPCGLPLDRSSKASLNENRAQYADAAHAFDGEAVDAFFLNGFSDIDDLRCALMGVAQVSGKPVFASVVLCEDALPDGAGELADPNAGDLAEGSDAASSANGVLEAARAAAAAVGVPVADIAAAGDAEGEGSSPAVSLSAAAGPDSVAAAGPDPAAGPGPDPAAGPDSVAAAGPGPDPAAAAGPGPDPAAAAGPGPDPAAAHSSGESYLDIGPGAIFKGYKAVEPPAFAGAHRAVSALPVSRWPEAIALMEDLGAAVVGFETAEPPSRAIAYAKQAAGLTTLPLLAQLRASAPADAKLPGAGLVPLDDIDEYTPDTMAPIAVKLYGAGVQFLRATGSATPAYTGALAATVFGLDVRPR